MTSLVDLLKKPLVVAVLALIVGLAVGIPLGWKTVTVVDTTPAVMRSDLQQDYLRMAIDSFRVNRDPNLAVHRWDNLGPAAAPMFVEIRKESRGYRSGSDYCLWTGNPSGKRRQSIESGTSDDLAWRSIRNNSPHWCCPCAASSWRRRRLSFPATDIE